MSPPSLCWLLLRLWRCRAGSVQKQPAKPQVNVSRSIDETSASVIEGPSKASHQTRHLGREVCRVAHAGGFPKSLAVPAA